LRPPHAFLCDFDGTVSPSDIGAAFVRRFSQGGAAESPAFLARWMRGEMGHRELTRAQCALLSVTREEALAFARPFALDPHFAPFVRDARGRGDVVVVVSEGFDFYVRDLLERQGLGDLPWSANTALFEAGRVTPEFPDAADGCGRCGNCKGAHVRAWRERGYRTVLIGDGLSDRCGAREAGQVIARRDLLTWCTQEGITAIPFEDFADVLRWYQAPTGAREGRRRQRPPAGEREPGMAELAEEERAGAGCTGERAAEPLPFPGADRRPEPGTGRSSAPGADRRPEPGTGRSSAPGAGRRPERGTGRSSAPATLQPDGQS